LGFGRFACLGFVFRGLAFGVSGLAVGRFKPIEPIKLIEPIEPTKPLEPVKPIEPTKPTEPTKHFFLIFHF